MTKKLAFTLRLLNGVLVCCPACLYFIRTSFWLYGRKETFLSARTIFRPMNSFIEMMITMAGVNSVGSEYKEQHELPLFEMIFLADLSCGLGVFMQWL